VAQEPPETVVLRSGRLRECRHDASRSGVAARATPQIFSGVSPASFACGLQV